MKTSALAFLLTFFLFTGCEHSSSDIKPAHILENLVGTDGVSDMQIVFQPGIKVGDETVAKTFMPSYIVTTKGTMHVFCQGRIQNAEDNEPKVILMNTSRDFGKTWEGVRVLSGPMNHFAMSTYSSPTSSGERISFLTCVGLRVTKDYYHHNYELMKVKTGIDIYSIGKDKAGALCKYYSDDDGATWDMEVLTGDKTPLYQNVNGFTPVFINAIGQIHKILDGPNKGRYIMAAPIYAVPEGEEISNDFRNHPCVGSGIIYSDDLGESWKIDGLIADYFGNEASAVSIKNGNELLMIRRYMDQSELDEIPAKEKIVPGIDERIAHTSSDCGISWSDPFLVDISQVRCHGTLAKIDNRLYFSIPAGIGNRAKETWDADRVNGSIYFSGDEGKTWKHKVIEESYFSYSTIGQLFGDYRITFYSRGGHGDKGIGYRIFTDDWLDQ